MLALSPNHAGPNHKTELHRLTTRHTKASPLLNTRHIVYVDRGVGASPPLKPARKETGKESGTRKVAPEQPQFAAPSVPTPTPPQAPAPLSQAATPPSNLEPARSIAQLAIKRHASDSSASNDEQMSDTETRSDVVDDSPTKKARADDPPRKLVPDNYEECETRDLVMLIASMLLELISYNDAIPLKDGHLTRFHSRAPPGISVQDYLQRLTTHATLPPPILLSMVYYIDRLCALYPAFTITSLTVHRFLIVSATVASKGLSDSFWTNKTYAKVGGVSVKELALLELEFLTRLEWRIVPKPEVLVDYYNSLVKRSDTHQFENEPT